MPLSNELNYGFSSADFVDGDYSQLWVAGPLAQSAKLPTSAVITVDDASIAADDTSFNVEATTIKLYKFFSFVIGGVTVTLTADANVGATTLNCEPLSGTIADNSTANVYPMVPVLSINTANYQATTSVTRGLRNFGSPTEEGADPTSNQDQFTYSGFLVSADPGLAVIRQARLALARVYFEAIRNDGEKKAGAAAIQSLNENSQVGAKIQSGFTLAVDGAVTYTDPA